MPHAEQRAGYGDDRGCGKMRGCQCRTQTGILHTDFDSERFLRIVRQLADFGCEKAEQVADGVVQHHDTENQQSALNDFAFARADDHTEHPISRGAYYFRDNNKKAKRQTLNNKATVGSSDFDDPFASEGEDPVDPFSGNKDEDLEDDGLPF